jgi:hypothetical protein
MKKARLVLLMGLITLCLSSYGQQQSKYVYCQILGLGSASPLRSPNLIELKFSANMKGYHGKIAKDNNGKDINFTSMIDALNFMTKLGWELDQVVATPVATPGGSQEVAQYYFLKKNFDLLDDDAKKAFEAN